MATIEPCSTCRYWVPGDEPTHTSLYGWGECRCHPPQVVTTPPRPLSPAWTTVFPLTTGDLGCGDHKERALPSKDQIRAAITPPPAG